MLVRESNITSTVCSFVNAVRNQEHPKNHSNDKGNYHYHYCVPLLVVFHLFMVDSAIEIKAKLFKVQKTQCDKTDGNNDLEIWGIKIKRIMLGILQILTS